MEIGLRHKESGDYYPLGRTRVRVGSSSKNDIVLDSQKVSAEHVEIRVTNLGIEIDDLETDSGTFINDYRIDHHFLSNNDELVLGDQRFLLEFHQNKQSRASRCERCGVELDERTTRKLSRSILNQGGSRLLCQRCEQKETHGGDKDDRDASSIFKKLQHLHSATRKFTQKGLKGLNDEAQKDS